MGIKHKQTITIINNTAAAALLPAPFIYYLLSFLKEFLFDYYKKKYNIVVVYPIILYN